MIAPTLQADPDESVDGVDDPTLDTPGHGTGVNASVVGLDTSRSDHAMTERDEDGQEGNIGNRSFGKRKGAKGINHFSYCDRATQTTVPPVRVNSKFYH